jgi:two-component system sensor histidine kinase/response regulator
MFIWIDNAVGEVDYVSRNWLEFTGRSVEQEQGSTWIEGIHPDDVEAMFEHENHARRLRQPYTVNYRQLDAHGEYRWIQETGSPQILPSGEFTGYIAAGADITEIKEAQWAMEDARDRALEAAKTKADFLANLSHELRTPLNGILGMLELLKETDLAATQRKHVDVAARSGSALLELIHDLLDFSELEAGELKLENIDFACRHLLKDVVEMLAEKAHTKELELVCLFSAAVPERMRGEPGRLRQVLINLIGNAIKFTEHGEVVVRVCASPHDGNTVRFEVSDTGVGIAPERHVAIFESFSQADTSTGYGWLSGIARSLSGGIGRISCSPTGPGDRRRRHDPSCA